MAYSFKAEPCAISNPREIKKESVDSLGELNKVEETRDARNMRNKTMTSPIVDCFVSRPVSE